MRSRSLLFTLLLTLAASTAKAQEADTAPPAKEGKLTPEDRAMLLARNASDLVQSHRFAEARTMARQGLDAAMMIDASEVTTMCWRVMGEADLQEGNMVDALAHSLRAVMTSVDCSLKNQASAGLLLARVYEKAGFSRNATNQAKEVLSTGALSTNDQLIANRVIVRCVHGTNEPELAQRTLDSALGQARASKDVETQCECLKGLCRIASAQGRNEDAIAFAEEAVLLGRMTSEDIELGIMYNNLGRLYDLSGKYREAGEALQEAADRLHDQPAFLLTTQINQAIDLSHQGKNPAAHELLERVMFQAEAAKNIEKSTEAHLFRSGMFLQEGRNAEAAAHAHEALKLAEVNDLPAQVIDALRLLHRIEMERGRADEAAEFAAERDRWQQTLDERRRQEERERLDAVNRFQREENRIVAAINEEQRNSMQLRQTVLMAQTEGQQIDIDQYKAQLKESFLHQEALLREKATQELALSQAALEAKTKESEIIELESQRQKQLLRLSKLDLEQQKKQTALEMLKKQNALLETDRQLKAANQRRDRLIGRSAIAVVMVLAVLAVFAIWGRRKMRAKNGIIASQLEKIGSIKDELEVKNKDLMSSITYARSIQRTIVPTQEDFSEVLPGSFLFYRPRDVVSGDLPFLLETTDHVFVAAIDCTGHGVPAAMLSFIAYFNLNQILQFNPEADLGQALQELHARVIALVSRSNGGTELSDGMDIGLCRLNKHNGKLHFCGAGISMIITRNGNVERIRGDKRGIGDRSSETWPTYTEHSVAVNAADHCYLFSDGMIHQFGGENGRSKLSTKGLMESLAALDGIQGEAALDHVNKVFDGWKQDVAQTDDALLIGFNMLSAAKANAA